MANFMLEGMPMHESNMFLGDTSAGSNFLPERKKLELKPRSARTDRARRRSTSAKGDPFASPFGAARPREEVLKSRGLDIKDIDSKIEKKVEPTTFSKDEEAQLEVIRTELTQAEARFRDANEKELPEEGFRVQVVAKRKELNELVETFSKLTAGGADHESSSPHSGGGRFSLPSSFAPGSHHSHHHHGGSNNHRR